MAPEQQQPFGDAQQQHVMFTSDDYRDALNNGRFEPLDEAAMGAALQQFAPVYPAPYADPYGNLYMRQPPAVSFAGLSFLPQQQQQQPPPLAAIAAPHANYALNNNNNNIYMHSVCSYSPNFCLRVVVFGDHQSALPLHDRREPELTGQRPLDRQPERAAAAAQRRRPN